MYYCEECGAKIIPGSRFCEECGTPVPEDEFTEGIDDLTKHTSTTTEIDTLFSHEDWSYRWESAGDDKGLIVFNSEGALRLSSFYDALSSYICFSQDRGIHYCPLNLRTQVVTSDFCDNSIYSILEVLKKIYSVSKPEYLLLIGDEKSISDISWENESYDGDSDVFSDLPYLTFDYKSPFSGIDYCFSDYVSVGRIPCSANDGFSTAVCYFNNVIQKIKSIWNDCSFGLSAYVWKDESEACFASLGKGLLCSPDVTLDQVSNTGIVGLNKGEKPSIMYFNLHGSNQTSFWYGQKEDRYPEVMDPIVIGDYKNGYFIGVEACYGAKYHDCRPDESILLTALRNGCLGFLGSSMIAYGTSKEPGCCADIIVREYLSGLRNGLSSGHSYLKALERLCGSEIDDATIKTMAEFALYGDPSLCMDETEKSCYTTIKHCRSICVSIPSVRRAVNYSLCSVSEKIDLILKSYIEKYHHDFSSIIPKHYFDSSSHMGQSVYEKDCGEFRQYLKLYYDAEGSIKAHYLSK